MKRAHVELLMVVALVALAGWLGRPTPERTSRPPLTFNGLKPGDRLGEVEARLGPPDFRNPQANFQQWEHPLTQIHYEGDVITEVAGSGTGVLARGQQVLLRCGDPEEAIVKTLGPPRERDGNGMLYSYDRLSIHCGTESQGQRWVSHIQLNR